MKIIEYSKERAQLTLDKWRNKHELPELDADYSIIKNELLQYYSIVKNEAKGDDRQEYLTDVLMGLRLYEYFGKKPWFNLRTAANDGFWRFISVAVIPAIVAERWGISNDKYFWKQSNRLWPKTAWWYIHLSFSNTIEDTKRLLLNRNFSSDNIQALVDRTGKKGSFVEVYREIMSQYGLLDYSTIVKFKKKRANSDNLFRAIMRQNTARCLVIDPCLYEGGVSSYVNSMINDLTIKL